MTSSLRPQVAPAPNAVRRTPSRGTPGPWVVAGDVNSIGQHRVEGANGARIALVDEQWDDAGVINAYLIAGAPGMNAALRDTPTPHFVNANDELECAWCRAKGKNAPDIQHHDDCHSNIIASAIAKAEGRV